MLTILAEERETYVGWDHIPPELKTKKALLTDVNLAKSLYLINKSAKKSRDTKKLNYQHHNYGVVSRSKTRQNKLYALKNQAIQKLVQENKAKIIGYHIQKLRYSGEKVYLLLLEFAGYTFHLPINKTDAKNYNFIGEIDLISADSAKNDIKFNQAIDLIKCYIDF